MNQDPRQAAIVRWLRATLGDADFTLETASSDASFRRYFRVTLDGHSRIVMDAPPEREACSPFLAVAERFAEAGLHVPRIEAASIEQGFLLLEDLGSTDYLHRLDAASADRLYGDALDALLQLQRNVAHDGLPPYDAALLQRELDLFPEWYLDRHLGQPLSTARQADWQQLCRQLIDSAQAQPQVTVHRDYHARNLIVTSPNPGIIDFQDAVVGPVTYDLVSLLRDCYIAWPPAQVEAWVLGYRRRLLDAGLPAGDSDARFLRWFDWMGVQRHLKVAGIFSRLWHRDGKRRYLDDLPLTLHYIATVAARYPELAWLCELPGVEPLAQS